MKRALAKLQSVSPYSQSKVFDSPKEDQERSDVYEDRVWRERCHVNAEGNIFIPPAAFANSLKEAAKYMQIPIKGKGKATYTKNFNAGVMVVEPLVLPDKVADVVGEKLFVPADGKPARSGSARVHKTFPMIPKWSGTVEYVVMDDLITEEIFSKVLITSGTLVGIGRFRPLNRGFYGRFQVLGVEWSEYSV